jgi:hypothetical protein
MRFPSEDFMTPTPSHAALSEVLTKHLVYEIVRFVEQYELLRAPDPYHSKLDKKVVEIIDDALIVSCTHARNLLEFFFRKVPTEHNYALATDYAKASYVRLDRDGADLKRLYGQLCARINHLTHDRTDQIQRKIGPKERDELVQLIHDEAARLETELKASFDKQYLAIARLAEAKAKSQIPVAGSLYSTIAVDMATLVTGSFPQVASSTADFTGLHWSSPAAGHQLMPTGRSKGRR